MRACYLRKVFTARVCYLPCELVESMLFLFFCTLRCTAAANAGELFYHHF